MHKHVLLACMPKSGSTFLCNAIAALPHFNVGVGVPDWGRREQELDDATLSRIEDQNYVLQLHVRYSNATRTQIEKHRLLPLVLVRNIFDVVPSFIDHHRKESLLHPMAFVPEGIQNWSFEESARFVSTMIIPWYFNFYMSWYEAPNTLMIRYEKWVAEPEQQLTRICQHIGLDVEQVEIDRAVSSVIDASPRKNAVNPGRGSSLPSGCVEQIRSMAQFYRGTDFSPIGL
ncbi:sulfotransferase domain-containing protein [Phyllobacterium sp. LjRoot231]|uniref:sulfotransferase domain-containing protein n=1 Tax=Phyllobacterium sp. LjRoot231 TaxID=3342289 RepID=UPI003ECF427D